MECFPVVLRLFLVWASPRVVDDYVADCVCPWDVLLWRQWCKIKVSKSIFLITWWTYRPNSAQVFISIHSKCKKIHYKCKCITKTSYFRLWYYQSKISWYFWKYHYILKMSWYFQLKIFENILIFWKYHDIYHDIFVDIYHDIFASKYQICIMIYIIDIYHWYFRANPDKFHLFILCRV